MTLRQWTPFVLALCSVASAPCFAVDPAKNVLTAGSFEASDAGRPTGWTAVDDAWRGVGLQGGETRYLRLTGRDGSVVRVTTTVPLDPSWKWVTLGARLRAPDVTPPEGNKAKGPVAIPFVNFVVVGADGGERSAASLSPALEGGYRDWRAPQVARELRAGDKEVRVTIAMPLAGAFDVDDVIVIPFDPKDELDPKKVDELQKALEAGQGETVKALIAADPRLLEARDASYDGATPLGTTGWTGRDDMTALLLDLGADRDAVDRNWKAPAIGWAAFFGRPAVVKVLLEAGADPNSSNGAGATALESAEFGLKGRKGGNATDDDRREVIQMLKDAGGTTARQKKRK